MILFLLFFKVYYNWKTQSSQYQNKIPLLHSHLSFLPLALYTCWNTCTLSAFYLMFLFFTLKSSTISRECQGCWSRCRMLVLLLELSIIKDAAFCLDIICTDVSSVKSKLNVTQTLQSIQLAWWILQVPALVVFEKRVRIGLFYCITYTMQYVSCSLARTGTNTPCCFLLHVKCHMPHVQTVFWSCVQKRNREPLKLIVHGKSWFVTV